ncbi:DUF6602 domain-containing protein [Paenibacillus sp. MSJ-34]|uniref:DUF6602 domain-containing protein n=1 Tax=Paenibacillus sp. MSJ-34 TaxID=2841529 RepID=UPI0020A0FF44|nr:DUF6602 domain-containing protein [Paenibacillus sp. MSJ-34]
MAKESLTPEKRKQKLVENIQSNYRQVEQSIVNQLYMKHDLHGTSIGSAREDIWRQLFEMIVPKKFVIEYSVFIIDSEGRVSNEVDLAILDETYTPYIFRYGRLKFIPIEAVAVVVECKSQSLNKDGITNWYNNIEPLKTANNSIARIAGQIAIGAVSTQQSTHPIRILCALKAEISPDIENNFDFTLVAVKDDKTESGRIEIKINADSNLMEWFMKLNFHNVQKSAEEIINATDLKAITLKEYEVRDENDTPVSLLTFNFQLNQLLMLINNPILFPHRAYANLFDTGRKDS